MDRIPRTLVSKRERSVTQTDQMEEVVTGERGAEAETETREEMSENGQPTESQQQTASSVYL